MDQGLIVLVSDRPDRSKLLADAILAVTACRVVGTEETWEGTGRVQAVVADITLSRPEGKRCLRRLAGKGARTPLIYLSRGPGETAFTEARNLGATLCLSAHLDPRAVVESLAREVWPDHTVGDLILRRETGKASAVMARLFQDAESGRIDMPSVERGIDPVLRAIQEGGLTRWLETVRLHDDLTFQHCLLVSGIAAAFARNLSLSKADQQLLTRAALVHDVGKACIPRAILNKPGRLDDDERAVMQTHAALGHDILVASGGCDPVTLGITRHHHEMLDGSGYPDQLRAGAIGDPIRLLTICDIYAALVERRPYKPPMSPHEALGILQSMNGKLEGGLVQAFGRAITEVE